MQVNQVLVVQVDFFSSMLHGFSYLTRNVDSRFIVPLDISMVNIQLEVFILTNIKPIVFNNIYIDLKKKLTS